ncbi:MAG: hypothetical protein HC796_11510 [Synechococcaceae cyanobacterium RL_1_2]|nr:hypothetical protein [Synechococcaceae cyanobacterium RL_1_2]
MARFFSLPWVLTVPFVFNLVAILGCLAYVDHRHHTKLNGGVAYLFWNNKVNI